jgi:hypothetical protein
MKSATKILLSVFVFVFFSADLAAQHFSVKGKVADMAGKPLARASVLLLSVKDSSVVTYSLTDNSGQFLLQTDDTAAEYLLKVSCIGFSPYMQNVTAANHDMSIGMKEDGMVLQDVVVKAKSPGVFVHNDTINYNIRKYADGTEQVLGDVLAKLPGMQVDNDGNVTANGKKVDKILVNGNTFFGDHNEQITKNLPSKAVDKVQLLNNYSDYSFIKGFDTHHQTAINVGIDSLHSNRITGNAELWGGYDARYRSKLNLYSFGSNVMWGLNAKLYNTGEEMMSLMDYIKLQGGVSNFAKSFSGYNGIIDDNFSDTQYLEEKENSDKRRNAALSFNIAWNPSKSCKVNAYYIYNYERDTQKQMIDRHYLTDASNLNAELSSTGVCWNDFHKACLDIQYTPTESSVLRNNTSVMFSPSKECSNIFDVSNQNLLAHVNNFDIREDLSYVKKWSKKSMLSMDAYYAYNKNKIDRTLTADSILVNPKSENGYLSQTQHVHKYQLGASLSYLYKLSKAYIIKGMLFGDARGYSYESSSEQAGYRSDKANNDLQNAGAEVSLKKNVGLFQFNVGLSSAYVNNAYSSKRFLVSPSLSMELDFSALHSLSLSYDSRFKQTSEPLFVNAEALEDYHTVYQYAETDNTLKRSHDVGLVYNYFNILYDVSCVLTSGYIVDKEPFTCNYTNIGRCISANWIASSKDASTYYMTLYLRKEFSIPLKVAVQAKLTNSTYQTGYSGILSDNAFTDVTSNISLQSTFRHPFNLELGGNVSYKRLSIGLSDENTNYSSIEFFIRPFYIIKNKFNIELPLRYIHDRNSVDKENYWTFSPNASYNISQHFTLFLEGKNIFHANEFRRLSLDNTNAYIDRITEYRMPGYILLGVKYSL